MERWSIWQGQGTGWVITIDLALVHNYVKYSNDCWRADLLPNGDTGMSYFYPQKVVHNVMALPVGRSDLGSCRRRRNRRTGGHLASVPNFACVNYFLRNVAACSSGTRGEGGRERGREGGSLHQ